jgi:hypothetical protein
MGGSHLFSQISITIAVMIVIAKAIFSKLNKMAVCYDSGKLRD